MSRPFDPTLKDLVESYPADWLAQFGLATDRPVDLIDADLSTITTQSDKVVRVRDDSPWLVHVELQASWDGTLPRRVLKYNVLLHDRHQLPVHSVVVLLRPEADHPGLTGSYQYQSPRGSGRLVMSYQVVRVWQEPAEAFLTGGLGTLPLTPLSDVSREALPAVISRMEERLTREAPPAVAASLWTSTYILMGLRYPPEFVAQLLRGVRAMKESATYQAILAEGREQGLAQGKVVGMVEGLLAGQAAEARKLLLLVGSQHLGPPDEPTRAAINAMTSIDRLERLTERLLSVTSWDELLKQP